MKLSNGKILVISAPSGAGKTSIARKLLERYPDWRFSISATTREKRAHEVEGHDYYFLSADEFRNQIEAGELVEWEEIYGSMYGTLRREVERLFDEGTPVVLFDIDVKGALSIKEAFPDQSQLVFVAPPDVETLRDRLIARNTESEETLSRRLERVSMEMSMQGVFDLVVVNDDLERAVEELVDYICTVNE